MIQDLQITEMTSWESVSLEELSQLLIDVVEDGASIGFLPPLSREEASQYWKSVIQPGVITWIAKVDQKIGGTIQLHLAQKPNATHRAEVAKLMVHPSMRRRGIARALMIAAEKRAKWEGRSLIVLDTRSGDPSNRLYQSCGYVETGRIPRYAKSSHGGFDDTIIYYKEMR